MAGEHKEVEAEDRRPDIALERQPRFPGAAIQPKDPLQKRDVALHPSSKVTQPFVHPTALDHGADFQSTALRERHILDPQGLDLTQVHLRSETAVEDDLPG